jgi:DNA-binding CsgD family transcriptional regulator
MNMASVIAMYNQGMSLNRISNEVGVSIPTITKKLKASGVQIRSNKQIWENIHNNLILKIKRLNEQEGRRLTYKELAERLGTSVNTISKHMRIELNRVLL